MAETNQEIPINAAAAAALTGLAPSTLAKLRCVGGGPPFIKLGRKVVYRRADLADWLNARRVANTTEAALSVPRRLTDPLSG
jgi:predicted DNA-binding transcriptional regulator AlpA